MNRIRKTAATMVLICTAFASNIAVYGADKAAESITSFHGFCQKRYTERGRIKASNAKTSDIRKILKEHPEYAQSRSDADGDALAAACRNADVALVRALAPYYADNSIHYIDRKNGEAGGFCGMPYLHLVSSYGNKTQGRLEIVELLLHEDYDADPTLYYNGVNAFGNAAACNTAILERLLANAQERGDMADVLNADANGGVTAMSRALMAGNIESVRLLSAAYEEAGLNFDIPEVFDAGVSDDAQEAIVSYLEDEWELNTDAEGDDGVYDIISKWRAEHPKNA